MNPPRPSVIVFALLLPFLARPLLAQAPEERPIRTIGVVFDVPETRDLERMKVFFDEIDALTSDSYDVRVPDAKRIAADGTLEGARAALERLLADPEVDLVLALGPLASHEACRIEPLAKPVVAPVVIAPELQGTPREVIPDVGEVSGRENLNYITFPLDFARHIEVFKEIVPGIRKLAVLFDGRVLSHVPGLRERAVEALASFDIEAEFVPLGEREGDPLPRLPAGTDAVYLGGALSLTGDELEALLAGFIERRLPSFSLRGRAEVEAGALLSLTSNTNVARFARRTALHVQRLLAGEPAATLPVRLREGERLTINVATASAIGVYPSWGVLTEADLVGFDALRRGETLTLSEVMKEAVEANKDYAAARFRVLAGRQDVRRALSVFFPQVDTSAAATVIDVDRARASIGASPEWSGVASATARQLLYSEEAFANYAVQKHLQRALEADEEQVRLEIVLQAAEAYLNVLRQETLLEIQREDLRVTRVNLQLARLRREIGVSNASEVYRWESRIATNRREILRLVAALQQARIEVNRVRDRPLEEVFETAETGLDDRGLRVNHDAIRPYIENPWASKIFRDFLVGEGLTVSPELAQVDASLAAQRRTVTSRRRAFWSPELAMVAGVDYLFWEDGTGARQSPTNDTDWFATVQATFPLYRGGAKRAEYIQAKEEVNRLTEGRIATSERVEQRIRASLHSAVASYFGIELARAAAVASQSNLELVTDSYSQGTVSIVELLDAQNAALEAKGDASNSVYDYMIDMMNVQRAVGVFGLFLPDGENAAWLARLRGYFQAAGVPVSAAGSGEQ